MSDKPTFGEILVSQLGTPKQPLGVDDVLFGFVLLLGIGGYLALEYGAGRLLVRLFRRVTRP